MKQLRKKIPAIIILFICITVLSLETYAQPDSPEDTPIDGGLSLLLAAGAAYGVKKYRDARKKDGEEKQEVEVE